MGRVAKWFWLGLLMAGGCGHGPRSINDADPSDKIPAIELAVQRHDLRAAPQLVKGLESDDSAVRFYSIDALQRLTGQGLGYRYYEDADARKPAVERWKAWLAAQPKSGAGVQ